MYRTADFDEYLSEQLKKPKYRREYLLALMAEDDGESGFKLLDALKHIIAKMGVTEFAALVGMERPNVSRVLSQTSLPKIETLNRFLAPFGLKVKIDIEEVA